MKPLTTEWVAKAEEDFLAALDLSRRRKVQLHNSVCFHCQQCAEKYLKARLQEAGAAIPKTHDLEVLLDPALPLEPLWSSLRTALQELTAFAVGFRYPGEEADRNDATRALENCRSVRKEVCMALGKKS
jgi:HEPN domain-containing protein